MPNYIAPRFQQEFPTLLEHSAWTPPPALSPPQPLRCFTVINPYNIPERTRGVTSCTSQMKRAEAERLNGSTKNDKETSVAAGTEAGRAQVRDFFRQTGKMLL